MPVPGSTDLACLQTLCNLFLLQQSRWCPVGEVQHEHGARGARLLWHHHVRPFVGDVHGQDLCTTAALLCTEDSSFLSKTGSAECCL